MSDIESYHTVKNPEQFAIDWRSVYYRGNAMTDEVRAEFRHVLDEPYGSAPKQRLDVYLPTVPAAGPVFIFLHGGGFREGDRRHYGYVARPLLETGVVVVVASYRLTPQAQFPDQPADVRQIVAWTHANIAASGGDPGSLFLGGHSAGAILTAFAAGDRAWMDDLSLPRSVLKAMVPISAPYDLRDSPGTDRYLPSPDAGRAASPLFNVVDPPPSLLVAGALEDPIVAETHRYHEELQRAGCDSQVVILDDADHSHTVLALADSANPVTKALLELIAARG